MSDAKYKQIFSQNLRYYMSLNNQEQIDLINDLGFNKSAVSTWCNGTRLPRMDKVNMLAEYFHINRSDLIEARKDKAETTSFIINCNTDDESNLILSYRKLNDSNKKKCTAYTNTLLATQQMEDELPTTIAAHFDGDKYTEDELEEIRQFAEFAKNKRK